MTRQRVSPFPPRTDPETTISREFTLPTARTFTLSGTASISALIPDDQIDRLVGLAGSTGSGTIAYSEGRLNRGSQGGGRGGDRRQPGHGLAARVRGGAPGRRVAAVQPGQDTHLLPHDTAGRRRRPAFGAHLATDHRHPTDRPGHHSHTSRCRRSPTARWPARWPPCPCTSPPSPATGSPITVTGVRLEYTTNYYRHLPHRPPPGHRRSWASPASRCRPSRPQSPATCQSNLVSIDGRPITVMIVGSTAKALDNGELSVEPCGADAAGITLSAGPHVVETALADTPLNPSTVHCQATHDCTGWNIDQLTLDSAPGGGPEAPAAGGAVPAPQPAPAPTVATDRQGATSEACTVQDADQPFELVLGQSIDAGWQAVAHPSAGARAGSHSVDLGQPELVDSFANGWPVTAAQLAALGASGPAGTASFSVTFTWAPQKTVWAALGVSRGGHRHLPGPRFPARAQPSVHPAPALRASPGCPPRPPSGCGRRRRHRGAPTSPGGAPVGNALVTAGTAPATAGMAGRANGAATARGARVQWPGRTGRGPLPHRVHGSRVHGGRVHGSRRGARRPSLPVPRASRRCWPASPNRASAFRSPTGATGRRGGPCSPSPPSPRWWPVPSPPPWWAWPPEWLSPWP